VSKDRGTICATHTVGTALRNARASSSRLYAFTNVADIVKKKRATVSNLSIEVTGKSSQARQMQKRCESEDLQESPSAHEI